MKKNYSVHDYLTDPTFRQWVEDPSQELDSYWQEWMRRHAGCESKIREARELLVALKFDVHQISDIEKRTIWQSIDAKVDASRPGTSKHRIFDLSFFLKTAAVLAVVVASIFVVDRLTGINNKELAQPVELVKSANAGEKLTVKLQDGSMVRLNSVSRIAYPEQFKTHERRIQLEGEAFFDVSKDTARAFIVDAGIISVKAVGTSFSISNYPGSDSICVSLTQGKVLVSDPERSTLLEAGQMACYNIAHSRLSRYDRLDKELTGWLDDTIVFENADWNEIEARLERWFGVEIINRVEGPAWDYSGEFKGSLDKILKSICYAKNLNYKIENATVTIY